MNKRLRYILLLFCLLQSRDAFACPLCKDAVARMGEAWTWLGFNWSILFMIGMLTSLIASFTLALVYNYKKHMKKGA